MADEQNNVSIVVRAKDFATKVLAAVENRAEQFGKKVGGAADWIRGKFAGVQGLLAGIGVALGAATVGRFFQAAIAEATEAQNTLNNVGGAVRNLGVDFERVRPQVSALVDEMVKLTGKDADEVSDALANLITKTGQLRGSMAQLPLVMNLAAKEKISLAAASDLVAKTMNGILRPAKQLGIDAKDASTALAELTARYAGFAEGEGRTFTGTLGRIREGWKGILEATGDAIIGNAAVGESLNEVVDWLARGAEWLRTHRRETGVWVTTAVEGTKVVVATVRFALQGLWAFGSTLINLLLYALDQVGAAVMTSTGNVLAFLNRVVDAMNTVITLNNRIAATRAGQALGFTTLETLRGFDAETFFARAAAYSKDAEQRAQNARQDWIAAWEAGKDLERVGNAANARIAAARAVSNEPAEDAPAGGRLSDVPAGPGGTGRAGDDDKAEQAFKKRVDELRRLTETERTRGRALAELSQLERELRAAIESGTASAEERERLEQRLHLVEQARDAFFERRIALLTQGAGIEATRAQALGALELMERALVAQLKDGNLATERRIELERRLAAVRKAAAENGGAPAGGATGPNAPPAAGSFDERLEGAIGQAARDRAAQLPRGTLPARDATDPTVFRERQRAGDPLSGEAQRQSVSDDARAVADGARPTMRDRLRGAFDRAGGVRRGGPDDAEGGAGGGDGALGGIDTGDDFAGTTEGLGKATSAAEVFKQTLADLAAGPLAGLQQGFVDAFEAVVTGSGSAADALKSAVGGAIKKIAGEEGRMYAFKALASLAALDFRGAALYGLASAGLLALAGMGGAIGGGGGGGGGGGSSNAKARDELNGVGAGEAIIEFRGGLWDPNNPYQLQSMQRMLEKLSDKRVTLRIVPDGGTG